MKTVVCSSWSDLMGKIVDDVKRKDAKARKAMRKAKRAALAASKEACPVDTGDLQDSIHEVEGGIVADAPHAVFVHNGTVNHPPQPFLLEGKKAARRVLREELKK